MVHDEIIAPSKPIGLSETERAAQHSTLGVRRGSAAASPCRGRLSRRGPVKQPRASGGSGRSVIAAGPPDHRGETRRRDPQTGHHLGRERATRVVAASSGHLVQPNNPCGRHLEADVLAVAARADTGVERGPDGLGCGRVRRRHANDYGRRAETEPGIFGPSYQDRLKDLDGFGGEGVIGVFNLRANSGSSGPERAWGGRPAGRRQPPMRLRSSRKEPPISSSASGLIPMSGTDTYFGCPSRVVNPYPVSPPSVPSSTTPGRNSPTE